MFSLNNIEIIPSRSLLVVSSGVHLTAAALCFAYELPVFLQLLMAAVIFIAFALTYRTSIRLSSPFSLRRISWHAEDGLFSVCQKNGQWLAVTEIQKRFVTPFAIFISLRVEQRLFSVPLIIWRDSLGKDNFRRLRVLVAHARVASASSS